MNCPLPSVPDSSIVENKRMLRRRLKELQRQIPSDELQRLSMQLMERLERHPLFRAASTILLYHSLPDEPDTHALLTRYYKDKRILLPVVKGLDLELHDYVPENMQPGAYGILEPTGAPFTNFAGIDLAIVPGVAFTKQGHRLGRGRGYYDRLLSLPAFSSVYTLGLCFPHRVLGDFPVEAHDIEVREVLSL